MNISKIIFPLSIKFYRFLMFSSSIILILYAIAFFTQYFDVLNAVNAGTLNFSQLLVGCSPFLITFAFIAQSQITEKYIFTATRSIFAATVFTLLLIILSVLAIISL